jgi:primosomal protein N' (replication factor Y)
MRYMGIGIEKVISQLALIFPALKICRLDKEHQTVPNDFQILVATEMFFHQEQIIEAEIIALLDIDSMMQIVNFMANEKLYALLYRCRNRAKEEIVLQTRIAAQYQRKEFTRFDLDKLFQAELKDRKALQLPPFRHLGSLNLRGKNQERAKNAVTVLYGKLKNKDKKIQIFEPMENAPLKLRGSFRYQILLKAKNPLTLSNFLRKHLKKIKPSGVITTVDIDPQ